ncbi:MAG TPA: hypothetical protein VGM90_22920 [Kofleriaceae bacterium]
MRRLLAHTLVGLLALGSVPAMAAPKKAAPAKKAPAKAPKEAPKKKAAPPSADNKKKLLERMGGFKWGMSKDEIIATLEKQIAEKYDEQLKDTTDVAKQDRIRKDKKTELGRVKSTYVEFADAKPSPWDVSIIEGEFAHGTDEAMMERWENEGGKNNRRFFLFYQGKLWKMYISLDVSILPEDKKNFESFVGVMTSQFGPGDIGEGTITWSLPEAQVRATDKLKTYDAIGFSLEDPNMQKDVLATRETHKKPEKGTSSVINAVVDKDGTDHPDVKANGGAVDAVINANGGKGPKK